MKKTDSLESVRQRIQASLDDPRPSLTESQVRRRLANLHARTIQERWLKEQVGPTYDAMKADPSQLIDSEAVFSGLQARHQARVSKKPKT